MLFERILRSAAAEFVAHRDGVAGGGPAFREFQRDARRSREELRALAAAKLQAQIRHAHATVPYYRESWAGIELPREGFQAADLQRLPFLSKSVLRERSDEMRSTDPTVGPLKPDFTGGTTGTQVRFYRDRACTVQRIGRQRAVLDACGYARGMRRALVWGAHADLSDSSPRPSLRARLRRFASGQIILPGIVMTEAEMATYVRHLQAFRPEVLYGYPNALTQFAGYVAAEGIAIDGIHTIITTAERLSELQRRRLRQVFGGEVFNLYCTREYGCVGFECRRHDGMHVDTGSVCVEIVRDGRNVAPGEIGEIVVTDLLNRGMPFVRSATGDQGSLTDEPCSCGLPFPLLRNLDGRTADVVVRPDGGKVMGLMLTDLFMDHPTIRFVQFVQEPNGDLEVRVVATQALNADALAATEREVRTLVGDAMSVTITQVPEIARNPRSGKFQEVINRMPLHGNGGSSV